MEESNKSPCQPAGSPHCVYTSTFGFAPLSSLPLSLLIFYPSFPLLPTSYSTIKTPLPLPTRWTWTAIVSRVPSEPSGETGSFDLQFPGPGFPSPFFQLIHPLTPRPWGGEQTSRARGKERESGVEEKMPQLPVSSQATVPEEEGKRAVILIGSQQGPDWSLESPLGPGPSQGLHMLRSPLIGLSQLSQTVPGSVRKKGYGSSSGLTSLPWYHQLWVQSASSPLFSRVNRVCETASPLTCLVIPDPVSLVFST